MPAISPKGSTHFRCEDDICTQCQGIVTRAYHELINAGDNDRDAYLSVVRVLELRHPGHDRVYYFLRVAKWLDGKHWPKPSS